MQDELARAIAYRQQQDHEKAQEAFSSLYERFPDNPLVNYHFACLHDSMGAEREAVPYYVKAIENGLTGEDRRGALLGLGSTYRTLGEYDKSAAILQQGIDAFPEAKEFVIFHAMTLYNLGKHHDAMHDLLNLLVDHTQDEGILRFQRAIRFYADDLDQVWK